MTLSENSLSTIANKHATMMAPLPSSYSAKTALVALRTYGLTEKASQRILLEEVDLATSLYGIAFQGFFSPFFLEKFGEQHVTDALSYGYHFMAEYEMSFELYSEIINKLMEMFKPEEIIISPEKITHLIHALLPENTDEISSDEKETLMEHTFRNLTNAEILEIVSDADSEEDFDDDYQEDFESDIKD